MNQEKIGKFISECRKNKKMTQTELAEKLGVSDKTISNWENSRCMPDLSLFKSICDVLDISINELISGEKIKEDEFKEVADNNLFNALESSIFTIKDKVDYFKRKWEHDHAFELTLIMLIIAISIIYCFIKDNGFQFLFIILGFVSGIIENNRMMAYVERNVYGKKSKMTLEEFENSIEKLKSSKEILSKFKTKKDAVTFLMKETNLSKEECSGAYDFINKLDLNKIKKEN